MTREASWQVEGTTLTLLRHVASLGYVVSVHRLPASLLGHKASIEMHAIGDGQQHIARISANDADADYRCACALAELVGMDLEDG